MSTDKSKPTEPRAPVGKLLSLADLTVLLVKHYGLHEGCFDLMLGYQIGSGAVGPDKEHLVPGVMIGVGEIGLVPSTKPGPRTVDAAKVNPKKPRKRAT